MPEELEHIERKRREMEREEREAARQIGELRKMMGHEVSEIFDEIIEKLSELEHEQWVEWSKELAEKENLSKKRLKRWKKCWIPYSQLSGRQKEFDRIWARKAIKIIGDIIILRGG